MQGIASLVPFRLYRSNRVEKLAEALAGVVSRPLSNVFARECIVVQGPGMERWLSGVLATKLGVWANPHFPFPRTAVEQLLDALLGNRAEEADAFAPDALAFHIATTIPTLADRSSFSEVARYLAGDRAHERLLALSRKLATTFDQYAIYRPELVLGWEAGDGDHFQAELWRAVAKHPSKPHLARRILELSRRDPELPLAQPTLMPQRLSLFGLSSVPPAFLRVLSAAAQHCDVHMFMLSPTSEYWGELDHREKRRSDVHGLLADLGKTSRELTDLLLEDDLAEDSAPDLYAKPSGSSLLAGLQADLLELSEHGPRAVLESDDSVRVHACHSRTRELEVLRDELRDRFERDASLQPSDVVVFAPDIESYAPAIEAVFSQSGANDRAYLPFRIADRKTQRASEVASAFLALLDLTSSRVPLSELLDLLHRPAVRERFAIEEGELDPLQHMLVAAGARWSIDAAHRSSFGQPAYEENSLRFAIDRLLLGYACPDGQLDAPFGALPCAQVEGQAALLLGKLARFADVIANLTHELQRARSVEAWAQCLSQAVSDTLSDEGERGLAQHALKNQLNELAEWARTARFDQAVSIKAMRDALEERLERARINGGFLAGGITFCEHVPMRAIPFRVVCLIGMDDESFPRSAARASFDLIADKPRRGDRNVRDDDRQLFLEALLSARDALLITYVGKSAQDDSPRPMSSLVEHLLRVIDRHFVPTSDAHAMLLGFQGSVSQLITRHHALHRFDQRYFRTIGKERMYSYDQRALDAARAQLHKRQEPRPFVASPLRSEQGRRELDLESLERFFRHPQKRFLKERLSVVLPRELDPVSDREPTKLDVLERYKIGDDMLRELSQLPAEQRKRVLLHSGRLPPGTAGEVQLDEIEALVEAVLSAEDAGQRLPDRDFQLTLTRHTLVGRIDRIYERARVEHLVSTPRTKHKLSTWIRHLALCATGDAPRRSLLIARDGSDAQVIELGEVANAAALLDELIDLYVLGMHMPLPYLHEPAQKLLDKLAKEGDLEAALGAAVAQALPGSSRENGGRDGDDPHVRQVFTIRQLEQLPTLVASDGELTLGFRDIAERILLPLQQHIVTRGG